MKTNFGIPLSRNEMKNVIGGVAANCHCQCEGSSASWTYSGEPTRQEVGQDILSMCVNGAATCGGCSNLK